jgi:hypothetical protein
MISYDHFIVLQQAKFEVFLQKTGVYKQFKENFKKNICVDLKDFCSICKPIKYVLRAFSWFRTPEEEAFWSNVNNDWIELYLKDEKNIHNI